MSAVVKTEYKCIISLNFTVKAARKSPTPNEKTTKNANGITDNITVHFKSILVATITRINAVTDASKLIKLENILDNTNKYFGTYTFLINGAFCTIDAIAVDVESL